MSISRSPWMGSVTLADTDTHRLSDLLADVAYVTAANQPLLSTNAPRVQYLQLGNDSSNGGAVLYVGNENVSSTFYGSALIAGQVFAISGESNNLILLKDVYVKASAQPLTIAVTLVTR